MQKAGIVPFFFALFLFSLVLSCERDEGTTPRTAPYLDTVGAGNDRVVVAVVKGTPYEMGKQLGTMLAGDIQECLGDFLGAVREEYEDYDVDWLLKGAWMDHVPYIDARVLEEMEGLAEGSGVALDDIRMVHMVPVVSPYACSGVVAWGNATADGHTYQLRNLDFTMDAGLQDHPLVVVYLPDQGIPHVNVTFAGYLASHTGINARHIVMGEKGRSPSSEYPYSARGRHFSFLFRTLMYDASSLEDVLNTLQEGPLIKRYCLYFAEGNGQGRGMKVAVDAPDDPPLRYWYDQDPEDPEAPDLFEGVVYRTMEDEWAAAYIRENHGKLDAAKMIELSKLVADDGGNLMDVVYDATTLEMWVTYANGREDAALQPYVHIDLTKYLKE